MKFVYNPACEALLQATPQMVAQLKTAAEAAAVEARAIAPVETGEYRDSIEGDAEIWAGKARGRVIARKFTAGWLEFGTIHTPTFAPLRRGVEAAGLKFKSARAGR